MVDGEFNNLGIHFEPARLRNSVARKLAAQIQPEQSLAHNADSLTTPTEAEQQRTMKDLFMSPSLYHAVNAVIGYAGTTHMSSAVAELDTTMAFPRKVICLAATLVSLVRLASAPYSCNIFSIPCSS